MVRDLTREDGRILKACSEGEEGLGEAMLSGLAAAAIEKQS